MKNPILAFLLALWHMFLDMAKVAKSRKAQVSALAAAVIIGAIIATAFAMIIGSIILGETYSVAQGLSLGTDANATVEAMYDIIWPSMQLLPLQILVLVGAAIMAAVGLFLARG